MVPQWKQHSSRFDKNPTKFTVEFDVCDQYTHDIVLTRQGTRWFMSFEPFISDKFPEELGEMTADEAKHAAAILGKEMVQKFIVEANVLVRSGAAVFPKDSNNIGWQDWTSEKAERDATRSKKVFSADFDQFSWTIWIKMNRDGIWFMSCDLEDNHNRPKELGPMSEDEARRTAAQRTLAQATALLAEVEKLLQ